MDLNEKQILTLESIEQIAPIVQVDRHLAQAVSFQESSLGINNLSPTGARGCFQMTTIAMQDLHEKMVSDNLLGTMLGMSFLYLLMQRWGKDDAKVVRRFCAKKDRDWYEKRVMKLKALFQRLEVQRKEKGEKWEKYSLE